MRNFRSELYKLTRRRTAIGALLLALVFGVGSAIIVFASASADPAGASARRESLHSLAGASGVSASFALGASFTGFFAFVLFIANVAGEFSQGTFRTLLMRQPERAKLLIGRMAALLVFVAGALVVALGFSILASLLIAPLRDVSVGEWFTADGLRSVVEDYGRIMLGVSAYALFATLVGVATRSVPIALGLGIAWAGPFEHLVEQAANGLAGWFPGLLLEAMAAGGTPDVSLGRAMGLTAIYAGAAGVAALLLFSRRDVTG